MLYERADVTKQEQLTLNPKPLPPLFVRVVGGYARRAFQAAWNPNAPTTKRALLLVTASGFLGYDAPRQGLDGRV